MCFVCNPFCVHILPPSTWQDDAAIPEACVIFSRLQRTFFTDSMQQGQEQQLYLFGSRILNTFYQQQILAVNLKHSANLKIEQECFDYPFYNYSYPIKERSRRRGRSNQNDNKTISLLPQTRTMLSDFLNNFYSSPHFWMGQKCQPPSTSAQTCQLRSAWVFSQPVCSALGEHIFTSVLKHAQKYYLLNLALFSGFQFYLLQPQKLSINFMGFYKYMLLPA